MLIDSILDEIISILFDDVAASVKQHINDKKIEKEIRDGINHIIEIEKNNENYDVLDRFLSNSHILQDYFSSVKEGYGSFDINARIDNLVAQMKLSDLTGSYIKSVVKRLCQVIEGKYRNSLSFGNKYLLCHMDADTQTIIRNQERVLDAIKNIPRFALSDFPSHRIPNCDGRPLIKRYIIPMNQGDFANNNGTLPLPIECVKQEKRVLLLSDAGFGKSYTLYQLFHEAVSENLQVVFYKLNEIEIGQENALVALTKGNVRDVNYKGNNVVLLLDGYDEMPEEGAHDWLIRMIRDIIQIYPDIQIVISSRSNANYSALINIGFKPYRIKPLNQSDVEEYLDENGVNKAAFLKQIDNNQLNDLCLSVFYLSEMIIIWRREQSLPSNSKLMEKIVDARISKDSDKYTHVSMRLEQDIRETQYRFERIALIMQCMHRDYITTNELIRITGDHDKTTLEYHGLWSKDNADKWKFAHNNFREYFAAVALSGKNLDEIKVFIYPETESSFIRPSWHNTLSYLIALYRKEDLQDWIISIQPELIFLFEKDRFTQGKRAELFIQLMDKKKEDHLWLDMDYSYRQKLVLFASSAKTVRYIVDELKKDISIRQKQNLLRCLCFFDEYYENKDDVINTVFEIANDTNNPDYYRADALRVMESQPQMFYGCTEAVSKMLYTATEESVRYCALLFLEASGTAEDYFNAVLIEWKRCMERHPVLISLERVVDRILNSICREPSASAILCYLKENIKQAYNSVKDEVFARCCEVGASTYSGTDDRILKCLLDIAKEGYFLISHEKYHAIRQYMLRTKTTSVFLDFVLEQKIAYYKSSILYDLMSEEMALLLLDYLRSDKISFSDMKEIIKLLPYNDPWQIKLIKMVLRRTGINIKIEPPVDYNAKIAQEHQAFFDMLFDKRAFSDLAESVCAIIGKETPIGKSVDHVDAGALMQIHANKTMSDWYYSIRSIARDDSQLTFGEYREVIGNWDEFCFYAAESMLKNHDDSIVISDRQHEWLSQHALNTLARFDLKSVIKVNKGRATYPALLYISLSIMQLIDIECDRDLAIQLLSIPSPLLKAEQENQLPTYAVKWLDEKTITSTIIANIHAGELNPYTAPAYAHYCMEHGITECKDDIIAYLIDKEKNNGFVYAEVEYVVKLFGVDTLLEAVLPHCDEERLLECIVVHIPLEKESDELDCLLWDSYSRTKDIKWLRYLIKRNNNNALEEYIKLCRDSLASLDKQLRGIVSKSEDAIRAVCKTNCLDSLINLMKVVSDPEFLDETEYGFGIGNSCWEAITNIAKANYSLTIATLEKNRFGENETFNERIGDLIQRIKTGREYSSDIALSFESAFMLTE